MNLCSPKTVRELLDKYGLAPKKGYGQNFLINSAIPERIAGSAAAGGDVGFDGFGGFLEDTAALEIGPGIGSMTVELSSYFKKVVAVEIDKGLIPLLEETLADCGNVTVVNEDFMNTDAEKLLSSLVGDMPVCVCANLPYYVTTPVLMKLLESYSLSGASRFKSITVMVQTEVADRICAPAGSSDYGALSVSVALHGNAEKLFSVSAGNFLPAPKVSSSVVQITLHENGIRDVWESAPEDNGACDRFAQRVKKLISLAFLQRRKTLVNALSSEIPKEKTEAALEELGIRADIRGEKLSARQYCALAELLYK